MARRGGEHLLDRRVADRGNDIGVYYSRARGEDRRPTRRFADRGSGGFYSDPRDFKMIKRLQRRVRDLEIQQEITQLRQRIRDLELKGEMRKTEAESSTVVWDEGDDGEEHPFYCHPPWFYEPINQNCSSEDEPIFDEDSVDFNEDECSFVEQALNGVVDGDTVTVATGCDSVLPVTHVAHKVDGIGSSVAHSELENATGSPNVCLETYSLMSNGTLGLTNAPSISEFQIENNINHGVIVESGYIFVNGISMPTLHATFTRGKQDFKPHEGEVETTPTIIKFNNGLIIPTVIISSPSNLSMGPTELHLKSHSILVDLQHTCGSQKVDGIGSIGVIYFEPKSNSQLQFSSIPTDFKPSIFKSHVLTKGAKMLNKKRLNAPFDPGGIGLGSGETTCEVKLFTRVVMIIINEIRVDVPFDPGGCGSDSCS